MAYYIIGLTLSFFSMLPIQTPVIVDFGTSNDLPIPIPIMIFLTLIWMFIAFIFTAIFFFSYLWPYRELYHLTF